MMVEPAVAMSSDFPAQSGPPGARLRRRTGRVSCRVLRQPPGNHATSRRPTRQLTRPVRQKAPKPGKIFLTTENGKVGCEAQLGGRDRIASPKQETAVQEARGRSPRKSHRTPFTDPLPGPSA